jgi:putative FmdB family regulatory protein
MPRYDYKCSSCGHKMSDIYQLFSDKPLKKCESCKKNSLERVVFAPHVFVRGEPSTLGQLAEKNSRKMGHSKVQEMALKDKESKKESLVEAKKEMQSKINSMNQTQKRRYIEDGKV